jgi:RNA polymerase sigma-70 factor (ECF subfamily)
VGHRASKPVADPSAQEPKPIAFADDVLLDRTRRGDMQAFGQLVAKYQDRLFNTVYRMCPSRQDAEELTQEALVRALEKLWQFNRQSQFYTWLFRIAVNLVISHRRRASRIHWQSLDDDHQADQASRLVQRRVESPEAAAMAAELNRRLEQALNRLDDEFRLLVTLRDIEDMDYRQIAEVLEVPVGTVKSRLHRARCALREELGDLMQS